MTKFVIAVTCFVLLVIGSPMFEQLQDTLVYEAAITKTCWEIHGLYFPGRWSCRSTYYKWGMKDITVGCLLSNNKERLCQNIEQIAAENKQQGVKR